MDTLHFKTNINCSGCVAKVTPALNSNKAIQSWEVDITRPDKILTVVTGLPKDQVMEAVEKAGFKAEPVS